MGYQISRFSPRDVAEPAPNRLPQDFDADDRDIWNRVSPYTLTSPECIYSLCRAVEYVVRGGIPGAFVECGVWKGGSAMAAALMLVHFGDTSRNLYMYDTYGVTWPESSDEDVMSNGVTVAENAANFAAQGWVPEDFYGSPDAVRALILSTGLPESRLHMVVGKVEETIPGVMPESIALLRLDTDWYESTRRELVYLYPRLVPGGVLMVDDYGSWLGARKATDAYFAEHNISMLLHRVDSGGYRIGVKR